MCTFDRVLLPEPVRSGIARRGKDLESRCSVCDKWYTMHTFWRQSRRGQDPGVAARCRISRDGGARANTADINRNPGSVRAIRAIVGEMVLESVREVKGVHFEVVVGSKVLYACSEGQNCTPTGSGLVLGHY